MSVPRSIDRSDLGGGTVTLTTTAETVVLIGPALQTPKDTSTVVLLGQVTLTSGTGTTAVTLRARQGTTVTGAVIGQPSVQATAAGPGSVSLGILVSAQALSTDYQQWCVTAQQTAASANGTVNGAVVLVMSF